MASLTQRLGLPRTEMRCADLSPPNTVAPGQRHAAKHACQMCSDPNCHAIILADYVLESSVLPTTAEPELLRSACMLEMLCRQACLTCMLHAAGLYTGAWCGLCGDRSAVAGADCSQPQASELLCAASQAHPGARHSWTCISDPTGRTHLRQTTYSAESFRVGPSDEDSSAECTAPVGCLTLPV